jgi:RHS repeat-associated protein
MLLLISQDVSINESFTGFISFTFNGKEKDDEWNGTTGGALDFGARIYDSRIGRWLACDPLAAKYPCLSPYQFVANMPLIAIDPDGKYIYILTPQTQNDGTIVYTATRVNEDLSNVTDENIKNMLVVNNSTPSGCAEFTKYINSSDKHVIITLADLSNYQSNSETQGLTKAKNSNITESHFDANGNYEENSQIDLLSSDNSQWLETDIPYVEGSEYNVVFLDENHVKNDDVYEVANTFEHELDAHISGYIENAKGNAEHYAYGVFPSYDAANKFMGYTICKDSKAYMNLIELATGKANGDPLQFAVLKSIIDESTIGKEDFDKLVKEHGDSGTK